MSHFFAIINQTLKESKTTTMSQAQWDDHRYCCLWPDWRIKLINYLHIIIIAKVLANTIISWHRHVNKFAQRNWITLVTYCDQITSPSLLCCRLILNLCLLRVTGGVQWKGAEPSIRNLSSPQFHILDRVHERLSLPAGLVHWWRHSAAERETSAVWPARLRCTESARLAAFPCFAQAPLNCCFPHG